MAREFKAFLACSFANQDEEVVAFFKKLIRAFDIEPFAYDFQEPGSLEQKVIQNIQGCDCLIALATKRWRIGKSDEWALPSWVEHELATAKTLGKQIAIFCEERVKLGGMVAHERRQNFKRENLLKNIEGITKFLFNIRSYLDLAAAPVLLRHHLYVHEEVLSRRLTVETCDVLIQCMAEELEATDHSNELEDTTPGLSVRPIQFDFKCITKPENVNVGYEVVQNTKTKHVWKVTFSPALKKGQQVRYKFKRRTRNNVPYTYEELAKRIRHKTYEFKDRICKACDWRMRYPTADFLYSIKLPEKYQICDYRVDVRMGFAKLKADDEVKRINELKLFTVDPGFDRWSMTLRVPKPLYEHTYYLYYVPPKATGCR